MRLPLALALMLSMPGAAGCGTTKVFTDDPSARIWANGQMIGKGQGEIQQYGMPETTTIMVRAEDGRQETTTVKRKITGVTVLGAFLTYGTCLIFCWSYPDGIWAALPARAASPFGGPGSASSASDPWLLPPPGWQPKAATTTPTTTTPTTTTPPATSPAEAPAPANPKTPDKTAAPDKAGVPTPARPTRPVAPATRAPNPS